MQPLLSILIVSLLTACGSRGSDSASSGIPIPADHITFSEEELSAVAQEVEMATRNIERSSLNACSESAFNNQESVRQAMARRLVGRYEALAATEIAIALRERSGQREEIIAAVAALLDTASVRALVARANTGICSGVARRASLFDLGITRAQLIGAINRVTANSTATVAGTDCSGWWSALDNAARFQLCVPAAICEVTPVAAIPGGRVTTSVQVVNLTGILGEENETPATNRYSLQLVDGNNTTSVLINSIEVNPTMVENAPVYVDAEVAFTVPNISDGTYDLVLQLDGQTIARRFDALTVRGSTVRPAPATPVTITITPPPTPEPEVIENNDPAPIPL